MIKYIFVLLLLLPIVSSITIDPDSSEKIGPLCNTGQGIWNTTIDGHKHTFSLRYLNDRGIGTDLIADGTSIYLGHIPCEYPDKVYLSIDNGNKHSINVTYSIEDITPGANLFMIMFLTVTPIVAITGMFVSLTCLSAGLLSSRCLTEDMSGII